MWPGVRVGDWTQVIVLILTNIPASTHPPGKTEKQPILGTRRRVSVPGSFSRCGQRLVLAPIPLEQILPPSSGEKSESPLFMTPVVILGGMYLKRCRRNS